MSGDERWALALARSQLTTRLELTLRLSLNPKPYNAGAGTGFMLPRGRQRPSPLQTIDTEWKMSKKLTCEERSGARVHAVLNSEQEGRIVLVRGSQCSLHHFRALPLREAPYVHLEIELKHTKRPL